MTSFNKGDKVQSKIDPSRIGYIEEVGKYYSDIQYYRVFWGGNAGSRNVPETDLRLYIETTSPGENLISGNLAKYQDFQRLITYHRLLRDHPLSNHIYAFNASRTRFYPYQFKPLMKFLDSPHHRVLVCDEVGLGKTIEAGLILTEFRARQSIQRVLVVCPSNLTHKWRMELRRRFGEEFRVLKSRELIEYFDEYEEFPDRVELNGIASLETCRSKRVLERLETLRPEFDIVIVDEGHHMRNFGRKQRRVGVVLSQCSTAMIMLTATPVHLGNENLYSLLNILDEEDFRDQESVDQLFRENAPIIIAQNCVGQMPPNIEKAIESLLQIKNSSWTHDNPYFEDVLNGLYEIQEKLIENNPIQRTLIRLQKQLTELNLIAHIFTRTRKREVHKDVAQRRASAKEIEFNKLEKDLYDAVTALVQAESEAMGHLPVIIQWRLHMPQRRLASCIPAMVEYYREKYGFTDDDCPEDMPLQLNNDNEIEVQSGISLDSARNQLHQVISMWPKGGPDSKFDALLEIIDEVKRNEGKCKILLFSFFKATLGYLYASLKSANVKAIILSGDIDPDDRPDIIERFRIDESIEVLLCSRVGSEGLDFQFCSTMVNYDLPWNPMEVEQRIGRLDRIGQQSPIISIWNFWAKGTIEERILRRLYDRIGIFKRSIGDIEVILGDTVQKLERELLSKKLTPEEQERRENDVMLVVERQMRDLEELENSAAKFIGTDQYFLDEVEAIKRRRRYVTGEQIRRFIEDFIKRNAPRTRLKYEPDKLIGRIFPDENLISILRNRCRPTEITRLIDKISSTRGIPVTFDSEIAYENPKIEFINVLHPLLSAITQEYDLEVSKLVNAHHVVLSTDQLPNGFYFYFIYLLKITAARNRNTLECILISEELDLIQDDNVVEIVFGEMVEMGSDPDTIIEIDPQIAEEAHQLANKAFHTRLKEIRETNEKFNDKFVDRRLKSLLSFYDKRISHHSRLLEEGQKKGSAERYLRMQSGRITNLESEKAQKSAELEAKRNLAEEYNEIAAGILEVI